MIKQLKNIKTLSALFILLSFTFPSNKLTEYDKWLNFHRIKHSNFPEYGISVEKKVKWESFDLSIDDMSLFKPYRLYSLDSTYFIDLDSYSLVIEKENGTLISYGSEVERKVQVIRSKDFMSTTLLFCGTDCYPETVNWLTDNQIEILGFSLADNKYIPTKWSIDLSNMLFNKCQSKITFNKMPKSYMELERLKNIEFKK